jgi:hypothetical protein
MEGFLTGKPYCCGLEISERQVQLSNRNRLVDLAVFEHQRISQQWGTPLPHLHDVQPLSMLWPWEYLIGVSGEFNTQTLSSSHTKWWLFRNLRNVTCEAILEDVPTDADVLSSDAHFHLSGCINKQNFRRLHERPLHSERVTVWCSITGFGIIGPYFFEE